MYKQNLFVQDNPPTEKPEVRQATMSNKQVLPACLE